MPQNINSKIEMESTRQKQKEQDRNRMNKLEIGTD